MGRSKRPTSAPVPMNYAPGPKVDNFSLSSSNAQFHAELFSLPKHLHREGIQCQIIVICFRLQKSPTATGVRFTQPLTCLKCKWPELAPEENVVVANTPILRLSIHFNFAFLVKSQLTILLRFRLNSAFLQLSLQCVVQIHFTAKP